MYTAADILGYTRTYKIVNLCGNCVVVAEGFCDASSGEGGWLVIQRRQDGNIN